MRTVSNYYRGKDDEIKYYLSMANRPLKPDKRCKYKGVTFYVGRNLYCARLNYKGKRYYIGQYKTEKEAAIAWNNAALKIIGPYVPLNIIED